MLPVCLSLLYCCIAWPYLRSLLVQVREVYEKVTQKEVVPV